MPEEAAATVYALRPVWYTSKETPENAAAPGMYGLIAEEVAEVDPTLVYWVPDDDEASPAGAERPEAVHYQQLGPRCWSRRCKGSGSGSRSWKPSWRRGRRRLRLRCGSC